MPRRLIKQTLGLSVLMFSESIRSWEVQHYRHLNHLTRLCEGIVGKWWRWEVEPVGGSRSVGTDVSLDTLLCLSCPASLFLFLVIIMSRNEGKYPWTEPSQTIRKIKFHPWSCLYLTFCPRDKRYTKSRIKVLARLVSGKALLPEERWLLFLWVLVGPFIFTCAPIVSLILFSGFLLWVRVLHVGHYLTFITSLKASSSKADM